MLQIAKTRIRRWNSVALSLAVLTGSMSAGIACAPGLIFESAVEIGVVTSDKITEASGLAASAGNPGVFWTHNDGSKDNVYAVGADGSYLARFNLGKNPMDLEDIAIGPGPKAGVSYLYVGDIGSNAADREVIQIFRVAEPFVDRAWAGNPLAANFAGVTITALRYPDGTFDAEALLVDPVGRMLYVATKEKGSSRIYGVPLDQLSDKATLDLQFFRTVPFSVVSGGDISRDGRLIALRREDHAEAWVRAESETVIEALGRAGTEIPVIGPPDEPNGEALAFLPDGSGYVTVSEGLNPTLNFFRAVRADPDPPVFLGPPERSGGGILLRFDGCPGARLMVEESMDLKRWKEIGTVLLKERSGSFLAEAAGGTRYYRLRTTW